MNYTEWSRIGHANGWLGARSEDPQTSKSGAVSMAIRAGSQRHTLLQAYGAAPYGLTDEQAGDTTGLSDNVRCCYWKRCSELRQAGYISSAGITRPSSAGEMQKVCVITDLGRQILTGL